MNRKKVQAMFNIDISQTTVGQELLEEGKIEGTYAQRISCIKTIDKFRKKNEICNEKK